MILITVTGLVANLLSAWILTRKSDIKGNVNVRSAYLHVLGDALGSVGAIFAGFLMSAFSWYKTDPTISDFWQFSYILMEGTPPKVDADEAKQLLLNIPGVKNIHDLHVWTPTSGIDSLTCHLLVRE